MTYYRFWRNGEDIVVTEYLPIPKLGRIEWRAHDCVCDSFAVALNLVIEKWERTGASFALATEAIPDSREKKMKLLYGEERVLVEKVAEAYKTLTEVRRLTEKK